MIAFVDQWPVVEPYNGHFRLTFPSGSGKVELILTRAAMAGLERRCAVAKAKAAVADMEAEEAVVAFPKRRRRG